MDGHPPCMLRIADGPDEVHRASIAKGELKAQAEKAGMEMAKR